MSGSGQELALQDLTQAPLHHLHRRPGWAPDRAVPYKLAGAELGRCEDADSTCFRKGEDKYTEEGAGNSKSPPEHAQGYGSLEKKTLNRVLADMVPEARACDEGNADDGVPVPMWRQDVQGKCCWAPHSPLQSCGCTISEGI